MLRRTPQREQQNVEWITRVLFFVWYASGVFGEEVPSQIEYAWPPPVDILVERDCSNHIRASRERPPQQEGEYG